MKCLVEINQLHTKMTKKFTMLGIFISIILFPIGILYGVLSRKKILWISCELIFDNGDKEDRTVSEEEFFRLRKKLQATNKEF